jgi:hypothetical protein
MRISTLICLTPCLIFSSLVYSQDKIFLSSSVKEGKLLEITAESVEYQPATNKGQILTLPIKDIRIIFNGKGNYLIPSKWKTADTSFGTSMKRFISSDDNKSLPGKDVLYTNDRKKIEGNIAIEDNLFVVLANNQKVSKTSIAAITYANGNTKLYAPVDSVVLVLWIIQENSEPLYSEYPSVPEKKTVVHDDAQSRADSARKRAFEEIAGNISREDFQDRATQKTNKLNEYLKILCSKTATYEKSNEATDQAVNLFVNEDARVVTSSIKTNAVNSYKIRNYLTRVKLFKYDKIEIEWTHVQYVSDLKMGKDGTFSGVVSFEQVFRGYRDNQIVYSDITKKNAIVVLKTYNKNYEGSTRMVWDVLLSDIGVVYTKADE